MNADKLYKSSIGQIIRQLVGNRTQQFRLKDNQKGSTVTILDNRPSSVSQAKCMKNISSIQCYLPQNLTSAGNSARVWLGDKNNPNEKPDGIMCNEIAADNGNGKDEALKSISTKAGEIGVSTNKRDWAINNSDRDKYNDNTSSKMNPFQVPIKSVYPLDQDTATEIKLFYHYGPYNCGYIVKVVAGGEEGKMTYERPTGNDYSNVHNTSLTTSIFEQTNNQISNIKFDAYTKLAGEGARFECVRRNIKMISNDTIICSPCSKKGVAFYELWKTWSVTFEKKFNITDENIIEKLMDGSNRLLIDKINNGQKVESTFTEEKDVSDDNKIELIPSDKLNNQRFKIIKATGIISKLNLDKTTETIIKNKFPETMFETFEDFQTWLLNVKRKSKKKFVPIFNEDKIEEVKKKIYKILWGESD